MSAVIITPAGVSIDEITGRAVLVSLMVFAGQVLLGQKQKAVVTSQ